MQQDCATKVEGRRRHTVGKLRKLATIKDYRKQLQKQHCADVGKIEESEFEERIF